MENNFQQSQEPINPFPTPDVKPKFGFPKILLVTILIMILLGVGAYAYTKYAPKRVTTTGAIVVTHTPNPSDPYVELNKLLDLGEVDQDGFTIKNVSRSTEVAVFLDKPYDQNQAKFEAWLKANGYGDIPKEKIVYFHN